MFSLQLLAAFWARAILPKLLLSPRAESQRTYCFCRRCGPGDRDLAGVSESQGFILSCSPFLKLENRDCLGIWVPCLPACPPFSSKPAPHSHPLTAPSHEKATKPPWRTHLFNMGVGYCCLCQCVWSGRETTGGTFALEEEAFRAPGWGVGTD